jgi:hypothetical protein
MEREDGISKTPCDFASGREILEMHTHGSQVEYAIVSCCDRQYLRIESAICNDANCRLKVDRRFSSE